MSSRYPLVSIEPTMAFTATFRSVPFSSMPNRILEASEFSASAEITFSCLFTFSSMLGFTSKATTESTAK